MALRTSNEYTDGLRLAQSPDRGVAIGLFGFSCVWLAAAYLFLNVIANTYQCMLLLSIATVLLLPLAILYAQRRLDIFEPIVFANLALASMFLGRPAFDITNDTWIHNWFATFFDAKPGFDDMLMYALLGIVALQIGYLCPLPKTLARKLPTNRGESDPDRVVRIAWVMFGIGLVLFEEYVRQSGGATFLLAYLTSRNLGAGLSYRTASGYLFIGPLFWPPAGMIGLSTWLKTKKPRHLAIVILSLVFFAISMLGGVGRTFELQGLLGVFVIFFIARMKRPSFVLILPVSVLAVLFFVYDREARTVTSFQQKQVILDRIIANPSKEIVTIWSQDDAAMCDYFSVMVANIPDRIEFGNGSTLSDIVLRAYPRFLWPNNKKPDEHMVALFKMFFPAVRYRFSTGAAASVIADLYADHGGLTIFLGMFIFGVVIAIPKWWLQFSGNSLPAQLLFVAMPAYTVSLMRGGIPAFVEYLAITSIPVYLILKFTIETNPRPKAIQK